jgi:hypothetical protein
VRPSIETLRSAIASSSADCVFGVARLTSSASSTLQNTGPGRKENSWVRGSKMELPVTSPGSMSGVHCTRDSMALIDCDSARASIDLPTPGTSSKSTWPSEQMATRASRTTSVLPRMTRSTLATIAS